jgi:hypothetical protein
MSPTNTIRPVYPIPNDLMTLTLFHEAPLYILQTPSYVNIFSLAHYSPVHLIYVLT